ncbi:glycosyltransferase family 8 protein [Lactococcus insecticola]|uniref:Glycosyl transferase n=1 Tax=Pseudolactococcus insecticola TaxID=2709158 RepID=A0A6A0B4L0_9LACT|nr:glycosyltransferase [Lactococcus insecticola]GFH40309.1 hypothetical protein Hs20B_07070 [Lactococcus insecticola]
MREELNVVICGDDHFFDEAPAFFVNFCDLHSEFDVRFFAFCDALSTKHQTQLSAIAERYGQTFNYVKISENEFDFLKDYDAGADRWPKQAYYYMLAGKYLPESVDRAVYFDLDVLFVGQIMSFYHADFDGNYFIGKRDIIFKEQATITPSELRRGLLINTGVLMLNVAALRANHIDGQYMQDFVAKSAQLPPVKVFRNTVSFFADQGLLAFTFLEHIKVITDNRISHGLYEEKAPIIHLVGALKAVFQSDLSHVLTGDYPDLIYQRAQYELKAQMLLGVLTSDEVYQYFDAKLVRASKYSNFNLLPNFVSRKNIMKHVKSLFLDSNRIQESEEKQIARLNYRFSKQFMARKTQGDYQVKLVIQSSLTIENLGMIGFSNNSSKLTRLTSGPVASQEPTTFTATINFASKNYDGIGFSSYGVPIGSVIDLIDISIEKLTDS